ncbi:MAG: ATP-binding protein [Candidatus Krumholzibacteriia bacterium]
MKSELLPMLPDGFDERSLLAAVVPCLMEGLVVCGRDERFLLVNPAAAVMLGYRPEQLVGRSQYCVIPEDQRPVIAAADQRRLQGIGDHYEVELLREDGARLPVRVSGSPWHHERRFAGTVAVFCDLSDQRRAADEHARLEDQLRQAQKMEALGQLAGGIAHDFNNILQVILGFGELALMEFADGLPARGSVEEILRASRRAQELVQQVLSFGRRNDRAVRSMLLQPALKEGLKMLRSTLPATIAIRQEIATDCPPVYANPAFLHQILMNLCTNAARAMRRSGGTLHVVLEGVQVQEHFAAADRLVAPGHYVRLSVADDGVGMTPDVVERIFEPYYTTREPGEGTGLGLSVVHGIVTQLGGAVAVESAPGVGSAFHLYLPAVPAAVPHEVPLARVASAGGDERLLVVDDEPQLVRLLDRQLSALGYRVVTAADGRAALAAFHDDPEGFDLLLADQTMPGLTGRELLMEVRRRRPDLPVVICSGFSDDFDANVAAELNAVFLPKPITGELLARTIRQALDGDAG